MKSMHHNRNYPNCYLDYEPTYPYPSASSTNFLARYSIPQYKLPQIPTLDIYKGSPQPQYQYNDGRLEEDDSP